MKIVISFIVSLGFCFSVFGQNSQTTVRIDSFLNYMQESKRFLGSIAIQKGDKVVYEGDFNPLSNGTGIYRIGSISKVYTSLLIYKLIEQNKLNLDTKLADYYPNIKYAETITIANMLSHTSGIYSFTDRENLYKTRTKNYSKEESLAFIKDAKPAFKPTKDCSYSNSNFLLLGYIIEDITGKSYAQNIEEHFAIPFQLEHTHCEETISDSSTRESSYLFNGATWKQDKYSHPFPISAAGALVSTPKELCKLFYHLFNKEIISDASLAQMQTLANGSIGHGLFKAPFYKKVSWGHTGRIDEFHSFAFHFPDENLTLAMTTAGMHTNFNEIIVGILSCYYDMEYEFPVFQISDSTEPDVSTFLGTYKAKLFGLFPLGKLYLRPAKKQHLFLLDEDVPAEDTELILMERQNDFTFYVPSQDYKMTFVINAKGKVKHAIMEQGKFKIKCKKIE